MVAIITSSINPDYSPLSKIIQDSHTVVNSNRQILALSNNSKVKLSQFDTQTSVLIIENRMLHSFSSPLVITIAGSSDEKGRHSASNALTASCPAVIIPNAPKFAGVVQWQNFSFPS
jgi:hypothetical protein